MNKQLDVNLTGGKNLDKLLDALPVQLERRIVGGALNASAKPIIKSAKGKIHKFTGNLAKSLGSVNVKTGEGAKASEVKVRIGARRGGKFKGFHAHLLEFGTKERIVKKTGKRVGRGPKKPFLGPALREQANKQRKILTREIALRTHKEAKKLAAKYRTLK